MLDNNPAPSNNILLLGPPESERPRFLHKLHTRRQNADIYDIDDNSNTSDDQYQPVNLSINSNNEKQSNKKVHDLNNNFNKRTGEKLGYYVDKVGFDNEKNRKRRMSNHNEKNKKAKSPIYHFPHSSATSNSDRLSTDDDIQNDEFSSFQNDYNVLNGCNRPFVPIQEYSRLFIWLILIFAFQSIELEVCSDETIYSGYRTNTNIDERKGSPDQIGKPFALKFR